MENFIGKTLGVIMLAGVVAFVGMNIAEQHKAVAAVSATQDLGQQQQTAVVQSQVPQGQTAVTTASIQPAYSVRVNTDDDGHEQEEDD